MIKDKGRKTKELKDYKIEDYFGLEIRVEGGEIILLTAADRIEVL